MSRISIITFSIALCLASQASHAESFVVGQKDKQFTTKSLKVKVGDSVLFKNEDDYSHNVFSLSDAKSFDLGSYPKGESKSVTFDKPGTIEVECAVHPEMLMKIEVK